MKARDFREAARRALRGKWPVSIIAGLIASIFGAASGTSFSVNYEFNGSDFENMPEGINQLPTPEFNTEVMLPILVGMGVFLLVYCAIMIILGSVVSVGYAEFNLDLVDGFVTPRIGTLFSHFGQLKTAVAASLLVFVRVFIGMIFFLIPGIIAAYRYSAVYYVIAEHPNISARDALEKSKEIMWHNKWRRFCLDMSFLGWDLLCALTFGIASLWITPYRQAAYAVFYREASREREYI